MQIVAGKEREYEQYKQTNSKDPYSHRIVTYGEDWATLMEQEMAKGKTVAEVAKQAGRTADTDGITGFMYGAAASALAHFWIHGEEFRRWHNLDTQIGTEGEKANETPGATLNPALMTINT